MRSIYRRPAGAATSGADPRTFTTTGIAPIIAPARRCRRRAAEWLNGRSLVLRDVVLRVRGRGKPLQAHTARHSLQRLRRDVSHRRPHGGVAGDIRLP